jgi:alpha-L-fucosidase 2
MHKFARIFLISGAGCLGLLFSAPADDAPPTGHNILSPGDQIVAIKETTKGRPNILAETGDFGGNDGADELVTSILDGNFSTKYFCKATDDEGSAGVNTGFVVTPHLGATVVTGIQFATANDMPNRDPVAITIEGSNTDDALKAKGKGFTLIYKGPSGLTKDPSRTSWGPIVSFPNTTAYKSYRVLITQTRGSDNVDATQYSEVKLLGEPSSN